ncbi:probable membrane-associated kinase regulator 1 [Prosopis cineraria]|uniref:probable membrane-associated kinase regulator 1 n=1 Tax=Prosopis cineraria TaxID=364024 RepID=UPI00240F519D|nr:probable membrane-associated kinase regulator 1 [Prosopis cineraria]
MAAKSIRGEHEASNSEKKEDDEPSTATAEEEEDEEALSLCDLPDNLNKEEDQARKADSSQQPVEAQEEFDFLLWGGPFSKESEMCVADEVFFQGQILPLRKSFSSDASRLLPAGFNRSESSRSGSVTSEFRSSTSRSSSIGSQNSSSSISSTNSITNPEISKPRPRNQFHTHPSPRPQLKASNSRQVSFCHLNRKSKSSAWDFFRLGVAPAPEIGLQDLKVRCTNKSSVSRNSSNSSSDRSNHSFRQTAAGKGSGFLRGCKCSVETVPFDIMITKNAKKTESTTHAMKEKAKQKQRRKAMSRHRTFEWIKELSHASQGYNEEEALLANS